MKKKMAAILVLAVLLAALLPATALAHGRGGNASAKTSKAYALCTAENCNTTGLHKHCGTYYAGHTLGDGHEYHEVCTVQGCTKITNHEHNGVACLPHSSADGHNDHGVNHKGRGHH